MSHDKGSHPLNESDSNRDERRRVEVEVASRLQSRGIHLTGRETGEELGELLEAVERFERTVERHGGDLMVDEPVHSAEAREPDDRRFVLPPRREGEAVTAYLERLSDATDRVAK